MPVAKADVLARRRDGRERSKRLSTGAEAKIDLRAVKAAYKGSPNTMVNLCQKEVK